MPSVYILENQMSFKKKNIRTYQPTVSMYLKYEFRFHKMTAIILQNTYVTVWRKCIIKMGFRVSHTPVFYRGMIFMDFIFSLLLISHLVCALFSNYVNLKEFMNI